MYHWGSYQFPKKRILSAWIFGGKQVRQFLSCTDFIFAIQHYLASVVHELQAYPVYNVNQKLIKMSLINARETTSGFFLTVLMCQGSELFLDTLGYIYPLQVACRSSAREHLHHLVCCFLAAALC